MICLENIVGYFSFFKHNLLWRLGPDIKYHSYFYRWIFISSC